MRGVWCILARAEAKKWREGGERERHLSGPKRFLAQIRDNCKKVEHAGRGVRLETLRLPRLSHVPCLFPFDDPNVCRAAQSQEKPTEGVVVAIGPGRTHPETGVLIPLPCTIGDKVTIFLWRMTNAALFWGLKHKPMPVFRGDFYVVSRRTATKRRTIGTQGLLSVLPGDSRVGFGGISAGVD